MVFSRNVWYYVFFFNTPLYSEIYWKASFGDTCNFWSDDSRPLWMNRLLGIWWKLWITLLQIVHLDIQICYNFREFINQRLSVMNPCGQNPDYNHHYWKTFSFSFSLRLPQLYQGNYNFNVNNLILTIFVVGSHLTSLYLSLLWIFWRLPS